MKDIKSYVIGFLTCACLFLIMGQTKSDSQIGRYQAFVSGSRNTTEHLLDTKTGQVYNSKYNANIGGSQWTKSYLRFPE